MPDDDLPTPLRETVLRNPHEENWMPMSGPFWWERSTRGQGVAWMEGRQQYEGLAIRDTENPEAYICSTMYAPDLRGMR